MYNLIMFKENFTKIFDVCNLIDNERPLIEFQNDELYDFAMQALSEKIMNLEVGTMVHFELSKENQKLSKNYLNKINQQFLDIGHMPIPWLQEARRAIFKFSNLDYKSNYTGSVYIILKDGYTEFNGRYGVYVGQTSKSIEERYEEHKSGIRSGRGLKGKNIQILQSIFPFKKFKNKEKELYESAVNLTLKTVIPKVTGNVEYPLEKWPIDFQINLKKYLAEI